MDRYIGLDVHATSCTAAVIDGQGKRLRSQVIETNGRALVEFLKLQPGTLHVCIEEGGQSGWLAEILAPYAARVVVTHGSRPSRGQKNDELDAFGLAERLRTGAIGPIVYKETGSFATLRQLVKAHAMIVQDKVRVQNRIKALFLSRGVHVEGKAIYRPDGREAYLQALPESARGAAALLLAQYDALRIVRGRAEKELVAESHRHEVTKRLESCPGVGKIRAAQIVATVVMPARFRTRRQYWSYCGLGIVTRSSSDWVRGAQGKWTRVPVQQTRGLNRNHNALLKDVYKGAAKTVVQQHPSDPLHADYERMLAAGTKPNLARVTLARKIAAITLAMWKKKEDYKPATTTNS
jgi:transposase